MRGLSTEQKKSLLLMHNM